MKQYTLSLVLGIWLQSKEFQQSKDPNLSKYLRTALKLYVLPGIDPKTKHLSPKEIAAYSAKLNAKRLKNALSLFDEQFALALDAGKTSKATKGNYRSALGGKVSSRTGTHAKAEKPAR